MALSAATAANHINMHCLGSQRRLSSAAPAPTAQRARLVPRRVAANAADTNQTLQTVHRWFDSLNSPDHPVEDLVHRDCHLIDTTNQACYAGYKAIKHRMTVRGGR